MRKTAKESAQRTRLKRQAGEEAVRFVESGMVVGLGHGSTAIWALRLIAAKVEQGELQHLSVVPCSALVAAEAERAGLSPVAFDHLAAIDLTIDGADEVDPAGNIVKGAGGALLREKIVAQASVREIIVVDDSKLVLQLGTRSRLPVEIVPFGLTSQLRFLESLGGDVRLRLAAGGALFRTDQGNHIADCDFGPLTDPHQLARALEARAGIAGHGLFLALATDLIIADERGVHHRPLPALKQEDKP